MHKTATLLALVSALMIVQGAACQNAQLEQLQQQVAQQQRQLQQQAQELDELRKIQQSISATPLPPGVCDTEIRNQALGKGDARFASADYTRALGYYQDAGVACSHNALVEYKLGRAYQALGDRSQAARHYAEARRLGTGDDPQTAAHAAQALSQLDKAH